MHHQVFENSLKLVKDGHGHLVLDGVLVRSLALSEQTVCTERWAVLICTELAHTR